MKFLLHGLISSEVNTIPPVNINTSGYQTFLEPERNMNSFSLFASIFGYKLSTVEAIVFIVLLVMIAFSAVFGFYELIVC